MDADLILTQRMVFFDALTMKFRNVKIRPRNPACIVCGDTPSITDVSKIDYLDFCQTNCNLQKDIVLPKENTITLQDFAESIKAKADTTAIVDVRPPVHFGIVNLPDSVNIPFRRIEREEEAR